MVFRPGQRAGERRAARCAARPLPARKSRGISWFHCSRFWRKFQPAEEGRRRRRRGPVFPPRLPRPASGGWPGKAGKSVALPRRAEAKPGPPHVVRIRTDIFLRRGKCPRCRVRWGETGRSTFRETNLLLARAARGPGSFARGGRVPVRRRTRRFGHFALQPGKVFAPRRTTRRQCRVWLGRHRAAGRAKRGRAPPCPTGLRRGPVLPT